LVTQYLVLQTLAAVVVVLTTHLRVVLLVLVALVLSLLDMTQRRFKENR
jgi:hypothetical protein